LLPLKDFNPTRRPAVVTAALILLCVGIYFFVEPAGRSFNLAANASGGTCADAQFNLAHAAIPRELVQGHPLDESTADDVIFRSGCPVQGPESHPEKNVWLSVVYSLFLHASLLHLGGNMLFLWVFGNNIEDRRGPVRYLLFYFAAGIAATVGQVALDPRSPFPMIGASGAIAAVMGAYLVLYPNVRIRSLILFFIIPFIRDIRAKWLLAFWFVSQFFVGSASGVAWGAHVTGFLFGAAIGLGWRATGARAGTASR
jgi:membrane associated rhomboid family serine protease